MTIRITTVNIKTLDAYAEGNRKACYAECHYAECRGIFLNLLNEEKMSKLEKKCDGSCSLSSLTQKWKIAWIKPDRLPQGFWQMERKRKERQNRGERV